VSARRVAGLGALLASVALGHPAPNSTLRLDFRASEVRAEYWLPVTELAHARASDPGKDPGNSLSAYLLGRLSVATPGGSPWRILVNGIREDRYLEHDYLVAELRMVPPAGEPPQHFVLTDDVITHEVRNHRLFVVANRPGGNRLAGTLQYPARRLEVFAGE
jgi:hypothetical protein